MPQPPIDPRVELGLDRGQLPRHVAIIMDGNGRWANQRGLPRIRGHIEGAAGVREIITHCARLRLEALTLYSFSVENWKRPAAEVNALMELYVEYLIKEREEIMANDVRLIQLGHREGLPEAVLRELDKTQELSRNNVGLTLCLAINYGGRSEILEATRTLARRVLAGELAPDEIDEQTFSRSLYTADVPDPDLLVRTAGEMRVSNFLLWQISYAEFYVTSVLWPDFRKDHLNQAIQAYASRQRRFGGLDERVPPAI